MTSGKGGDGPGKGGPLRKWLGNIDHSVDDELNRFFSPTEKSRTGEAVDRYTQRIEASLQRASDAAIKTKVDLDAIGDDYVARWRQG